MHPAAGLGEQNDGVQEKWLLKREKKKDALDNNNNNRWVVLLWASFFFFYPQLLCDKLLRGYVFGRVCRPRSCVVISLLFFIFLFNYLWFFSSLLFFLVLPRKINAPSSG
jgi:hypothetical protein